MATHAAPDGRATWSSRNGSYFDALLGHVEAQSTGYTIIGLNGNATSNKSRDIIDSAAAFCRRLGTNTTWINETNTVHANGEDHWLPPDEEDFWLGARPRKVIRLIVPLTKT